MEELPDNAAASPIKQAIDEILSTRLKTYRDDPDRMRQDARSAAATTQDHLGRWFYELIQNADDAESPTLIVRATSDCLYFGDDGCGLTSDPLKKIKSLSGTHLSDKPATMIGHKGLGFKSVYAISHTPHVYSNGDGIIFSMRHAEDWMRGNGLDTRDVPYQWLPCWTSREVEMSADPVLAALAAKTVVKLPLLPTIKAEEIKVALECFSACSLLMFRHLRRIEILFDDSRRILEVEPLQGEATEWNVRDSGTSAEQRWRRSKLIVSPPPDILAEFERTEDRERSSDVSLLVAVPVSDAGVVQPAPSGLPLHVYYATENASPLRMLLHADFVVKSDRSDIIPPEKSRFNEWLSDKLAEHIVCCVDKWHTDAEPAASLRLLRLQSRAESESVGRHLWQRMIEHAKRTLRLPDTTGHRALRCAEACFVSTTAARSLARQMFARAECNNRLVHESLEADNDARAVMRELDCTRLDDEKTFELIRSEGLGLAAEHEQLWLCWCWVAQWVPENRKRDYTEKDNAEKRSKRLRALPILPVGGSIVCFDELDDGTLTWRTPELGVSLPDWLPLRFVDDWFRDQMSAISTDDPLWRLQGEVGIKNPQKNVVVDALTRSITGYWKDRSGEPGRFLCLIRNLGLHEKGERPAGFAACPVSVRIESGRENRWARADESYFGREWNKLLLDELFRAAQGIDWVHRPVIDADAEQYAALLEWLGVVEYPRLVPRSSLTTDETERERYRMSRALKDCTRIEELPPSLMLQHTEVARLDAGSSVILIRLLARHWARYRQHKQVRVRYFYRSARSEDVDAKWWIELRERLILPQTVNHATPAVLTDCWLPDRDTVRAVGELLPTIDIEAFGEDKELVSKWLRDEVRVRTRTADVSLIEWKAWLESRIPEIVPEAAATDDVQRNRVRKWYEAALDALKDQDESPTLPSAKLLCRKGEQWAYKRTSEVLLADDAELAPAFRTDRWMIEFIQRLHGDAARIFGLRSLMSETSITPWSFSAADESPELQTRLDAVKAFVFVWRCSHTNDNRDSLREKLRRLRVCEANQIVATAKLGAVERTIERQVAFVDGTILIQRGGDTLSLLAQGLAQSVGSAADAHFFENLMRCESHAEREKKIRTSNCSSEQVHQLLEEYSGAAEQPPPPVVTTPVKPDVTQVPATQAPPSVPPADLPPATEPPQPDSPPSEDPPKPAPAIRLKNVNIDEPTVSRGQAVAPPGGGGGGGGGSGPGWPLSDEQRIEVEKRGRASAARWLESRGYRVEQMSQFNPGFDLCATKGGECLLIELKAHMQTAQVVDLTRRELEEHSRCNRGSSASERWELWNVENLSLDVTAGIQITRYDSIPDDAFKTRILSLDLRRCSSSAADLD